jgi:hypothetical protein
LKNINASEIIGIFPVTAVEVFAKCMICTSLFSGNIPQPAYAIPALSAKSIPS